MPAFSYFMQMWIHFVRFLLKLHSPTRRSLRRKQARQPSEALAWLEAGMRKIKIDNRKCTDEQKQSRTEPLVCQLCEKDFISEKAFADHKRNSTGVDQPGNRLLSLSDLLRDQKHQGRARNPIANYIGSLSSHLARGTAHKGKDGKGRQR